MEGYKREEKKGEERAGKVSTANVAEVGLTVRAIEEIFAQAESAKRAKTVNIYCSFLQIYNEKVFDLLNAQGLKKAGKAQAGLKIRWSKTEQFTVENLFVFRCNDAAHAIQMYNKGIKNKIVASHNLNAQSSRSHAIFGLTVEIIDNSAVDNVVTSKLQLVDLAGSERSSQTGNTGLAAKEAIDINKSLFTLRQVITSLAEGAKKRKSLNAHIPYRDSKLTSLLKQSLGGNSYSLMVACLAPSDAYVEENLSTLNYAMKASFIANEPTQNVDPKVKLINELREKVASLQTELAHAHQHIDMLTQMSTGEGANPPPNFYPKPGQSSAASNGGPAQGDISTSSNQADEATAASLQEGVPTISNTPSESVRSEQ